MTSERERRPSARPAPGQRRGRQAGNRFAPRECYVSVVLPGETEFVTAGRFRVSETRSGAPRGAFVYGRAYLERPDALAMICGPAGRLANKANLLGAAGRFLLDRDEAEAVFDRIAGTIRRSWRSTMRRAGVSEKDCGLVRGAFLYDGLFFEIVPDG